MSIYVVWANQIDKSEFVGMILLDEESVIAGEEAGTTDADTKDTDTAYLFSLIVPYICLQTNIMIIYTKQSCLKCIFQYSTSFSILFVKC